jgi:hypothetical protein
VTRLEKQFAFSHALLWLFRVDDQLREMQHPSLAQYRAPLEARHAEISKYVHGLAEELGIELPAGGSANTVVALLREWYLGELVT